METQIERLTADNAALLAALSAVKEGISIASSNRGSSGAFNRHVLPAYKMLCQIDRQPHPGAKLLEELAALRKAAREAVDYLGDAHEDEAHPYDKPLVPNEDECAACAVQGILDRALTTQEAPNAPAK